MASLNEIPKRNTFRVPENYFEEVNRRILTAAEEVSRNENKVSFIHKFRIQLAVAASVAVFALIGYTGLKLLTHDRSTITVSEIFSPEFNESVLNDIDLQSLEENVSSSDLALKTSGPGSQEIIDYLLLENIEISDIYEKL